MLEYEHSRSLHYIQQGMPHSHPANANTSNSCTLLPKTLILPFLSPTSGGNNTWNWCNKPTQNVKNPTRRSSFQQRMRRRNENLKTERKTETERAHVIHISQKWLLSGCDETEIYPIPFHLLLAPSSSYFYHTTRILACKTLMNFPSSFK
jgi:hypothetical protein